MSVCLSLDNLSTNNPILFLFCTVVAVRLGQTPIHYEQNSIKTEKMGVVLLLYFPYIVVFFCL